MQNRATISSEIASSFPTNNAKFITAEFLRSFQEIINQSKFNLVDDTLSNINFNNADFTAGNAYNAVTELSRLSRPIFYVDLQYSGGVDVAITGTNHPNVSTPGVWAGQGPVLTISDIFVDTGKTIRPDIWIQSLGLTNTNIPLIVIGNPASLHTTRYYFYEDFIASDFTI